jgi:dipeptidase D
MTFVSELEPTDVWQHFDQILTIPRGSKNEGQMRSHVISIAERSGLEYSTDEAGNLVVRKPASAGLEGSSITILQSHLDMVNEKNSDVDHDFTKDPIQPQKDNGFIRASGTTLGSDNGIGVAAMLAIMEATDLTHGPLELLFTIDEESGLTGASNLDPAMLSGRRLINLDSEDAGTLCVGCAGGADSQVTLPIETEPAAAGISAVTARLHGLKGGHSGIDIHLQRGNAIQLLARAVLGASAEVPIRLARIEGGNMHNAIPREAVATITCSDPERLIRGLETEIAAIEAEFRSAEPNMASEIGPTDVPETVLTETSTQRILDLIASLPHGVIAMSYDIPGLVETSTNLATVQADDSKYQILLSSRSSVASALSALRRRIRATAALAGATVEEGDGYPGWKPDLESTVLKVTQAVHERELGIDPKVEAIHAGLECGLIGDMIPGMDMVSFGPQIDFPHSPDERVDIASVGDFYNLLTSTLAELAQEG